MRMLLTRAAACDAAPDRGAGGASASRADTLTPDEALEAEDARYAAQTAGDFAAMERLFADDLVYIHASGAVDNKAGLIEAQRSRAVVYRSMRRSDVATRVYGPVAIITGQGKFEVALKGEDRTVNLLFHSVWVKRGAVAQFVSWQATPLAAPTA
jgi:hypothetical protein